MSKEPFDFLILAGEDSGDLLGEKLLFDLKKTNPGLKIKTIAGPRMRKTHPDLLFPMEKLQVMGFWDVFKALPRLVFYFYKVKNWILKNRPKTIVLIDYPGFNLRLERALRKKGFSGKLVHYVCPSVWAHGKGRIKLMQKNLSLLLTLFPFEKELFAQTGLPTEYVGHPLLEQIEKHLASQQKENSKTLFPTEFKIGLFPGSRRKEIELNLKKQLQALKTVFSEKPFHLFISVAHPHFQDVIQNTVKKYYPYPFTCIPFAKHWDLMPHLDLAVAKSGTINLELALFGIPTCVTYKIRKLELFIAKDILRIRLPFYCIVNILQNKLIFPELYGPNFTQENLVLYLKKFLTDDVFRAKTRQECFNLKAQMKQKQNLKAAKAVLF